MVNPKDNGLPPMPKEDSVQTPESGGSVLPVLPSASDLENTAPDAGPNDLNKAISGSVSSVWVYLALQVGSAMIVTSLVTLFMMAFNYRGPVDLYVFPVVADAVVLLVATVISGVLAFLYARNRLGFRQPPAAWKNTKFKASDVFFGICSCWTLSVGLGLLVSLFSWLVSLFGVSLNEPDLALIGESGVDLINLATTVIAAPILEELIFRGCILESLKKYSTSFAIVFSSLLFALLHMNLVQGIPAFGMGLVFGWMYVRTGSLSMTIVLHLINNAVSMFSTLLPYPLSLMAELLLAALAAVGLVFMIREKANIKAIVFEKYQTAACWKTASRSVGFWAFVACAALICILPVLLAPFYQIALR